MSTDIIALYRGEPVRIESIINPERGDGGYAKFRDGRGRLVGAGVRHLTFMDAGA